MLFNLLLNSIVLPKRDMLCVRITHWWSKSETPRASRHCTFKRGPKKSYLEINLTRIFCYSLAPRGNTTLSQSQKHRGVFEDPWKTFWYFDWSRKIWLYHVIYNGCSKKIGLTLNLEHKIHSIGTSLPSSAALDHDNAVAESSHESHQKLIHNHSCIIIVKIVT